MLRILEKRNALQVFISSEIQLIQPVIRLMKDYLAIEHSDKISSAEIVLRELIMNAIHHGNAGDKAKVVSISLKGIFMDNVEIAVGDEGNGFDLNTVDLALHSSGAAPVGRGLKLVNALSNSLAFDNKTNSLRVKLGNVKPGFFRINRWLMQAPRTA